MKIIITKKIKTSDGACTISPRVVISSRKTNDFILNGEQNVRIGSKYNNILRQWYADAEIGWFVLRTTGRGFKFLDGEGGCKNAKPGTKLIAWKGDQPNDNNKFVFNSDRTIQSLCSKDLFVKVDGKSLILAQIIDPGASTKDIRFLMSVG